MASQLLRIQMAGGGPYGFRLLGGDKNPLTVAKIRPSSKAHVAGILEGDVILAINNICSQGLSHPAATSLMEGNNPALTVHALRGKSALSEVDSAMATLGPEVKRLTAEEASALVQNSGPSAASCNDQIMNGSEPYFRLQAPPSGGSLKQMRIARRESRDLLTPDDVAGQSSETSPGYYTREERTSTDGGKTTRIVEEVKTEKFGGTTLTKVTKQEFSSYKSSSADPRVDPFPPEFSVARSEEHRRPVPLGAPSDGGNQLRDERGWKTSTSVHKNSVRNEPYEIRIDTTQEPTKTYVIYQDGTREETLQGPVVGRVQQPIPAIQIQFHPNESGFAVEAKPPRVGANSNFEIRVGKEVTFQPKVQTSYEATQSHSEFHPTLKVHEPNIPSQSGSYSKFSHESNQTNYGTHPQFSHGNEPQSGYLVKQKTRIQPQNENSSEPHYKVDNHPQFGHTNDSHPPARPQVRFSAEPEYSYKPSASLHLEHAAKPHPDVHFRPGSDNPPELRNKPETNPQFGYISDPQPRVQSHLGNNPEPQPSTHPKFGYNSEHQSETHPQYGYNQEFQPEINSQFGHNPEPQPRTQSQYGYNKEPQPRAQSQDGYNPEPQPRIQSQYGHNPEPQPKPQSQYGYNPEPQPKPQSQYGYNPEPQPKPQSQHGYNPEPQPKPQSQYGYNPEPQPKLQSQYGYNPEPQSKPQSQYGFIPEPQPKPQSQYGYNKEQQPNTSPQIGYNREPAYPYQPRGPHEYENRSEQPQSEHNNRTNPQFGYNSHEEPPFQPSQPVYHTAPKHKAGAHSQNTYEPEPPPAEYNTYPTRANATPLNRQGQPQSYNSPAAHPPAPAQWGKKLPQGPAGHAGPGNYNPPEAAYDSRPVIPRQMDRIEIATAPKWIPGSKLPTKQPSNPPMAYNSNPPLTGGDPRGPHPDNHVVMDGYNDQSPEGGWHEAPVAAVRNRPNVSFSRVHDPTKQSTETEQSFEYGNAPHPNLKYGEDDYYPGYGREEEQAPGGQYGWPASGGQSNPSAGGHLPGQGNIWRPSGYGPSVGEEMDRSRGFGAGPAGPPPPPAPPLVPMMGGYGPQQPSGYCVEPRPLTPPPPAAPPIDLLKAYRGNAPSDRGYGSTSLEERVKMANSVAHSVLAPENNNSRGQKIFLRRRENSHKWTTHGPDPVPEKAALQDPTRSNTNVWAPKAPGAVQSRPPPGPGPQQLARPTTHDYPELNGRAEEPPGGGSAASYSLAEDMAFNSGKGGKLFAKKRAKADQWASAESIGQQGAPQNIRQGAPQAQAGYGSPAVPPSPGYGSSSYGGVEGGKGGGDYPVANRLKEMIKPKSTTASWNQQPAPQSPFAQGGQSTGPSLIRVASNPNLGAYRQVRFQGTSAISSSSVAPPAVQSQNFMKVPRFAPKQFGNRALVSQAAGCSDL